MMSSSKDTKSEADREEEFSSIVQEAADLQSEIDEALPDLMRKLERLSEELRRRGAFPVASQVERRPSTPGAQPNG